MSGSVLPIHTPHIVSISANARHGQYHIDVARDVYTSYKNLSKFMASLGNITDFKDLKLEDFYLMVWCEEWESEAAARKRASEIDALPYLQQRRLVQSVNPQWLDFYALEIGIPGPVGTVPEFAGMHFRSTLEL